MVAISATDWSDQGGDSPAMTIQIAVYEARRANPIFTNQYDLAQTALQDVQTDRPRLQIVA